MKKTIEYIICVDRLLPNTKEASAMHIKKNKLKVKD